MLNRMKTTKAMLEDMFNNLKNTTDLRDIRMYNIIKEYQFKVKLRKCNRNEPCPCKSGKKYKRCCIQ